MTELYIGTSVRNKKLLIWNFMEELCDKYEGARSKELPAVFNLQDFKSINLPIFSQNKNLIFEILKEYERAKDLIKINHDNVVATTKGLLRINLNQHDWD